MPGLLTSATALLSAVVAATASPTNPSAKRDIISALGESASDLELKFQPYLDFDGNGCYNTAGIDPSGYKNPGKGPTGTLEGDCRDPHQLENSNVYSRSRCNNGVCAVMYEYYFEKDQVISRSWGHGHRHDWENIVVFSREGTDEIIWVAPSAHDNYASGNNVIIVDGTHPLIVYHKDGASTHCFRVANGEDQSNPENHFGEFYRSPLVGWDNWPDEWLRGELFTGGWGGLKAKLNDDDFGEYLWRAVGNKAPEFNPWW